MSGGADERLVASVVWDGGELPFMEMATSWHGEHGPVLRGTVVGTVDGTRLAVEYEVWCTRGWETRRARVEITTPSSTRELIVVVDGGRWTVDGVERAELAGLIDVDIQITPATNTLPIARLGLAVGEHAEVTAAWIRVPELRVTPLQQRYTRTGERTYEYRSGDFRADLRMGSDGLVERYGSYWHRVGS